MYMPKAAARLFIRVNDVRAERVQDITWQDAMAEGVDATELSDEAMCDCCPLDDNLKGAHCYGGNVVMCEGSHCKEARQACEDDVIGAFASLWDSINAKRNGGIYAWDKNPWVWVYSFERVDKPEGWCV